ncbi:Gfo/Idh/MocA family protein [Saccharothrix sp. ALI-22-I]|uniref:Gfo/Idh/MocA family protein n=1 Tax=Saccharothrix sp. ALI-22-I TaxID=1933778 RepID=UPI00117B4803|nr:Gfo/Idh/MocA family oxidoreductase [Saccharothrix sp. ALI-22-I]
MRVGVLGTADIARRKMATALRDTEGIELTAVASRRQHDAERFAAEFRCAAVEGYEALLHRDDIDAVYIPLPVAMIARWVDLALRRGKHVLAEKTVTASSRVARGLSRVADEHGRTLVANFAFLHHRRQRVVEELLASGALGEIRLFRADFAFPPRDQEDIRYRPDLGGGALLDAGTYVLRAARWALGPVPEVEAASLATSGPLGVDVAGAVQLRSVTGVPAQLSFGFDHDYRCEYEIWGSRGRLRVERAFTMPAGQESTVWFTGAGQVEELPAAADDQYARMTERFLAAVECAEIRGAELRTVEEHAQLLEAVTAAAGRQPCR